LQQLIALPVALLREGKGKELLAVLPEFIDMASAEVKAGALAWMLSAMDVPDYPAIVHGYGSVIGTGGDFNALMNDSSRGLAR
jgi:2-aminophenol/2-amino-5-chlorophenol 1,6-dioxygenase beta subunit